MMRYLGYSVDDLNQMDGHWTAREIEQQPSSWRRTQAYLVENSARISSFLEPVLAIRECRIILTGAGTSAFVGASAAPALSRLLGRPVEAIATTDLVSAPDQYFRRDIPTLLISFARSGNSPESVAAVDLAESMIDRCFQLVVSCNADGSLYRRCAERRNWLALLMPEETNDRAFAMTSSFSSMLLSIVSIFTGIDAFSDKVEQLSSLVENLIKQRNEEIRAIAQDSCSRVIYLGSNGMKGLAQEACLKLLELTDGAVMTMYESSLGVRHGPKSMLNDDTLVIIFMSGDQYTRQYDTDILHELVADGRVKKIVALTSGSAEERVQGVFFSIDSLSRFSDLELFFPYVVFAQLYAFHRALKVGNRPDHPSASGTVNRVVQGVTIHALSD
ncbi:MAG: SIS domain-containing protein [Gammaproteobacteria bacterium]|nr:SIS domain-containing protein [Gammaproteobacteria bacterium]